MGCLFLLHRGICEGVRRGGCGDWRFWVSECFLLLLLLFACFACLFGRCSRVCFTELYLLSMSNAYLVLMEHVLEGLPRCRISARVRPL